MHTQLGRLPWLGFLLIVLAQLVWGSSVAFAQTPSAELAETDRDAHTFEECDNIDGSGLRGELNVMAQRALRDHNIDVEPRVRTHWDALKIDQVIAEQVAAAVATVRDGEAYLSRLWSAWSADKANELAERVTTMTFESEPFQHAITELSEAIAGDVAEQMEIASIQSVSSALSCLRAFVGQQYSNSLHEVFIAEVNAQVDDVEFGANFKPDVSVIGMHGGAVAGVGVIIGAQIAKRLARRLSQRIAGRIVTRVAGRIATGLVPLVGWIAGAGMIAWDLWEGADGALPHIEQALTSEEVAEEIRLEIVAEVVPELEKEMPEVANAIANRVYSTWREFKRRHAAMLRLAERNDQFNALMKSASTDEIYKLAGLVGVITETFGSLQLAEEIDRGRFEKLFRLPTSAAALVAETESIDSALAWGALAGDRLDELTSLGLHRYREPDQMSDLPLDALLNIGEEQTVSKLAELDDAAINSLLAVPAEVMQKLGRRYTGDDLRWLAVYLTALEPGPKRDSLLQTLNRTPELLETLKSERIKRVLVNHDDVKVGEALTFISTPRGFGAFLSDSGQVLDGNVPTSLMWVKYGTPKNILIFTTIVVIWIGLKTWRRRRDRRPIVVNVTAPAAPGKDSPNE